MADLTPSRAVGDWSYVSEYNAPQKMTGNYQVIVPFQSGGNDIGPAMALALARQWTGIPQYMEQPDPDIPMYAAKHTSNLLRRLQMGWLIQVTVEFVAAHLLESGYVFQVRTNLQSYETSRDVNGIILSVDYQGPGMTAPITQGGTVGMLRPTTELVATGITATPKPVDIMGRWIGRINESACWGFGIGGLLCSDVTYEPHCLDRDIPEYRFKFTWQIDPMCWRKTITWKDAEGNMPTDAIEGNGFKTVDVYQSLEYTTEEPFVGRL